MSTAIYPGSFDPITLGHLNIIRRASHVFDKIVVCVTINSEKKYMFSLEERVDFIKRSVARFPNVEVDTSEILLAEYAKRHDKPIILKGLRAATDFEYEFQMALINKKVNPSLDTLFLTAVEKYTYLSSTVVKEMARYGADIDGFVPIEIKEEVLSKAQLRR